MLTTGDKDNEPESSGLMGEKDLKYASSPSKKICPQCRLCVLCTRSLGAKPHCRKHSPRSSIPDNCGGPALNITSGRRGCFNSLRTTGMGKSSGP